MAATSLLARDPPRTTGGAEQKAPGREQSYRPEEGRNPLVIHCRDIQITAGAFQLACDELAVPAGSYGVLMGPTGCGKTTLLETLCGLRPLAAGTIQIAGRDATSLHPSERSIGYVPQEGAVFPRMTVGENLGFALAVARRGADEIQSRTIELAEQLGIAHLLDRPAVGLSGGERSRVALGRAIAHRPAVLLLDEPLAALDEASRARMIELLRTTQQTTGATTLHVTHSRSEAVALADVAFAIASGQVAPASPNNTLP